MAALTCDICGGKLIMDASGEFAVCESCGMQHSKERVKTKAQEITGVVQIDHSNMFENYCTMANQYFETGELHKADEYCAKALEIDPKSCEMWLLKGNIASKKGNSSTSLSTAYINAISYSMNDEEKNKCFESFKGGVTNFIGNYLYSDLDYFSQCSTAANHDMRDITREITVLFELFNTYCSACSLSEVESLDPIASFSRNLYQCIAGKYSKVGTKYVWESIVHPLNFRHDKYEREKYFTAINYCIIIWERFINCCPKNQLAYENGCKQLIFFLSKKLDCKYIYTTSGGTQQENYYFSSKERDEIRNTISYYQNELVEGKKLRAQIKEEYTRYKSKRYWDAHPDEKHALEVELEKLQKELAELQGQVDNIPSKQLYDAATVKLKHLQSERDALGIFKFKERNELQKQIDLIRTSEYEPIQEKYNAEYAAIDTKIKSFESRIAEIQKELATKRG